MNNNNRGSNRRRGRGNNNNRQQGGNQGNRIDSRARGNAPQMLEKYRKLAHDSSLNGDRVQAEYYHQFADHYFRVIADSRVVKDDQRPAQQQGNRDQSYDEEYREEEDQYHRMPQDNARENGRDVGRDNGGRDNAGRDNGGRDGNRDRPNDTRRDREQGESSDRAEGEASAEGEEFEPSENPFTRDSRDDRAPREPRDNREPRENRETRGRRPDAPRPARPRREAPKPASQDIVEGDHEDEAPRFDAALLPPAIGVTDVDAGAEERPRRKPRKPRAASTEGRDEKGGEELETVN